MNKYDAQLAVYQPKPTTWQKCKNYATNTSLAVSAAVLSSPAFAAFDVTEVTTEISSNKPGMNAVGLAVVGLIVIVLGFTMVKRMMR